MIEKLLKIIKREGIDILSFFILYKKYNSEIDFDIYSGPYDLFQLEADKYIKITNDYPFDFELRQKAIDLIKRIEGEFPKPVIQKIDNIEEFVDEYRELFKGLKPGAMGDKNACIKKFERFMKEYPQFSKNVILNATKKYIDTEGNNSNYKFLQKAHYFIYKQVGTKDNEVSNLASFCEEVGEVEEEGFTKML